MTKEVGGEASPGYRFRSIRARLAEYFNSSYAGLTRVSMLRRGTAKPYRSYTTAERQHGLPGQARQ